MNTKSLDIHRKSLHFSETHPILKGNHSKMQMNIILIIKYLKSFSQTLRHHENKPWISHKEALNINEVLFGYGERKYVEEN